MMEQRINTTPEQPEAEIQATDNSSLLNAGLAYAGYKGGGYFFEKYGKEDSTLSHFYQKLLGTDYINNQLSKAPTWVASQGKTLYSNQSLAKSMLSQLMAIEAASPLHILRTLQISNIINPFVDMVSAQEQVKFTTRKLKNQEHYYKALIEFANKDMDEKARTQLVKDTLKSGMIFQGGKAYGVDSKGLIDKSKVILNQANLAVSNIKLGDMNSPNLMAVNFGKAIGGHIDLDIMKGDPLMMVGGKDRASFVGKWGQGWLRYANEVGMKSLDNPLGGFEDMLRTVGVGETSLFQTKTWNTIKKYTNINLGTKGNYDLGIRESLKISAKNVAIKSTGVALGYEVLDSVLRTLSGPDGLFSEGIYTGITNMYAGARIKFAEVWSDKFQGYKNSQENVAKGSTDLTTLAALPATGALIGAQLAYSGRMMSTLTQNSDIAGAIYNRATQSPTLSKLGLTDAMKPMRRNALVGALAGAALALPFLPGALVGTSSDELKQLYRGEKEVAHKANRWWMFGGGKWDGSQTQYFSKHNVARVNDDATDKVRYGNDDVKKKLNPLLHPLAYIKDPYRYEKMHTTDMPYPVWGMDVNYGSIYGKIFERTVGQIIKPDIVNPAIHDMSVTETVLKSQNIKEGLFRAAGRILFEGTPNEERNLQHAGSISVPVNVNRQDASLINDNMMVAPASARYSPNLEASALTYQSMTDLIGLKGWVASMPLAKLGIDVNNTPLQLARSGEALSPARDLLDENLGDLFGFGEFQRKILGTSSGSLPTRSNPLINDMVSWLPNTDTQYYINFNKGNPYSSIKNGEERLPGVGYEASNPDLKGVDPSEYPLAYRFKILSDVAKGSREHIRARQEMLSAYSAGKLSKKETDILEQTLDQEVARDNRKEFYEPSSIGKRFGYGPVGYMQSSLWDAISANGETPLEMLTPIRPMAKFMHNRTAIEDYVATQLGGSDAAIWTNPYSHFIKPAANKSRLMLNNNFKGREVYERENINEYFDQLGHLRNRRNGHGVQDYNSTVASSLSGLNTNEKVRQFKKSLSDEEKDYFEAFSKETDEKKRDKIRLILPGNVARGYEQIWRNIDTAERARTNGISVQKAIAEDVHYQTARLKQAFGADLSKDERLAVKEKVDANQDNYVNLGFSRKERIQYSEDEAVRLKIADMEAGTYLRNTTGVPDNMFMGWDPRLKTDDIKIRTLSIGGEDLKRFGFWKKDEERMNRLPSLAADNQVVDNIDRIKANMRSNQQMKHQIEMTMFQNNFKVRRLDVIDSNYGSINIKKEESNGNWFTNLGNR